MRPAALRPGYCGTAPPNPAGVRSHGVQSEGEGAPVAKRPRHGSREPPHGRGHNRNPLQPCKLTRGGQTGQSDGGCPPPPGSAAPQAAQAADPPARREPYAAPAHPADPPGGHPDHQGVGRNMPVTTAPAPMKQYSPSVAPQTTWHWPRSRRRAAPAWPGTRPSGKHDSGGSITLVKTQLGPQNTSSSSSRPRRSRRCSGFSHCCRSGCRA